MNTVFFQRLEGAFIFAASIVAYIGAGGGLVLYAVLILVPDASIATYRINNRIGALTYNALHNFAGPALVFTIALLLSSEILYQLVAVWAGHVGIDRAFGFGLKKAKGFHYTHLGTINKN